MTDRKIRKLAKHGTGIPMGLHLIHWNSGGSSICAVGQNSDGSRWIAPTNWLAPLMDPTANYWDKIAGYTVLIDHPGMIDFENPAIRKAFDNLQMTLKLVGKIE